MGFYVDPPDATREDFLNAHGIKVSAESFDWDHMPTGFFPVVLMSNGLFISAGIAHDRQEFKRLARYAWRPKFAVCMVPVDTLLEVSPDFARWYRQKYPSLFD